VFGAAVETAVAPGPGAVRADDQVGLNNGAIGEVQLPRPVGGSADPPEGLAPVHVPGWSESSSRSRSCPRSISGLNRSSGPGSVGGDRARRVHLAHSPGPRAGEGEELREQAGLTQGDLAVVGMQVQGAALVARIGAGLAVVRRDRETVPLQDAGAGQPAGAGSDDADPGVGGFRGGHGVLSLLGDAGPRRPRRASSRAGSSAASKSRLGRKVESDNQASDVTFG